MGSPLCYFEYMTDDVERCKQFYGSVLGWEFDEQSMPGYTQIKAGRAPGGGMMKRPDEVPAPCMYAYFMVDDIPATLEKVRAAGGAVHHDKTEIPGIGWYAIAADPDGIPFGLFTTK